MAPGDLNLKKSWHPGLMKNRKKVWEMEQDALNERKKIQERQEEIRQEREMAELQGGEGSRRANNLNWMYETGPKNDTKSVGGEGDDFLLGKKRLDELIVNKKAEPKKLGFEKIQQSGLVSQQDEMAKMRDDPMMKIRQQQMQKAREVRDEKVRDQRSASSSRSHDHRSSHRSSSSRSSTRRDKDRPERDSHRRQVDDRDRDVHKHRDDSRRDSYRDRPSVDRPGSSDTHRSQRDDYRNRDAESRPMRESERHRDHVSSRTYNRSESSRQSRSENGSNGYDRK